MRDESEFVWAIDGNGDQVYVPRTHLEVFGDALTEVKPDKPANPTPVRSRRSSAPPRARPDKPANPTPATPDKPKEK